MLLFLGALLLAYAAFVGVGLIPVNNGFEPDPDGIDIVIASTAVHADFVVPARNEIIDWFEVFHPEDFAAGGPWVTHLGVGWGERTFYLETPTWDDVRASVIASALLLPSRSCLHVDLRSDLDEELGVRVRISKAQYRKLVDCILETVQRTEMGRARHIEGSNYSEFDAFYEAHGQYHCFNTCNSWIGWCLKQAGVRTTLFSPLPATMTWYLPESPQ